MVARQAHNLEVARSSRAPATKGGDNPVAFVLRVVFFICCSTGSGMRLFWRPLPNLPEGRLPSQRPSLPLGGDGEGSLSEAARAYSGSAPCLFRKRLALIAEAPRAYFGSARRYSASSACLFAYVRSVFSVAGSACIGIYSYICRDKTELTWETEERRHYF